MCSEIKVSVVIPVYNVEKYLEDCIDSVLQQTFTDIEVLCIDDSSSDKSLAILRKYSNLDSRIRVFQNTDNKGPSYTRNKGILNAQGKYIYFLDSDDMITPTALEILYKKAESENLDIIYFDAKILYESESLAQLHNDYLPEHKHLYEGVYTGESLFTKQIFNEDWSPSPPRQFFKREFIKSNNIMFYEGILHEDHLFWFTCALEAERTTCIYDKLFIRRFRENSIMTTKRDTRNLEGLLTNYCEALFYCRKSIFKPETDIAIAMYFNILINAAKTLYKELMLLGDIVELQNKNLTIQYLFNTIIKEDRSELKYVNILKSIKLLKQHDNIIIYGTGAIAKDIIVLLDMFSISILGCAVTKMCGNKIKVFGYKVNQINDLVQYTQNSIVVIATTKKHYSTIKENLLLLGFPNILYALSAEDNNI